MGSIEAALATFTTLSQRHLYTWRKAGLADEVRSDAIRYRTRRAVRGGYGAARAELVIHKYISNQYG
jgi:hypothetical protein